MQRAAGGGADSMRSMFTSATGARPEPQVSLYGATRAGANALVRAVGLEYAKLGICVNAIGTNFMDFPGFLKANRAEDPDGRARVEARPALTAPMRRLKELLHRTSAQAIGQLADRSPQFGDFVLEFAAVAVATAISEFDDVAPDEKRSQCARDVAEHAQCVS